MLPDLSPRRGWVPAGGPRVLLERPAARAALGLLVLLAVVAGLRAWSARAEPVVAPTVVAPGVIVPVTPSAGPPSPLGSTSSAAAAPSVLVEVVGVVVRPGVVRLPAEARVADALAAAGGVRPGGRTCGINLARHLVDGEQVVVGPVAGRCPAAGAALPPAASGGPATSGTPVDLNTAGVAELDVLPGIGPVLAQRIVDWRTAHGRFGAVDELRDVPGIGERIFATLAPLVRV